MAHNPSPNPLAQPGAIEFEVTDFADARRALDEVPAGVTVAAKAAPDYWEGRRRKPDAQDRALAGPTIDWMLKLPPELRPHALCERYPRVANAVAAAWPQVARRAPLLENLLGNARGRRVGFPAEVRAELAALLASLTNTEGPAPG